MTRNFIGRGGNPTALTREEREEVLTEFIELHNVDTDKFIVWLALSNDDRFYRFPDNATIDLRNPAQRHYLSRYEAEQGMSYDADMAGMTQILFANRHATYPVPPESFGFEFTPNMDALLMTFAAHLKHYAVFCAFDTHAMECAAPETLNALADLIEARPLEHDVFAFGQDWVQFMVRQHAKPLWTPKPPPPPGDDSDSSGDMPGYRP